MNEGTILVAVKSCAKYRHRTRAQRETWGQEAKELGLDLRFFLGQGCVPETDDEVVLPAPDGYDDLPAKVRAICLWAQEQGYEWAFLCDDDVYVQLARLKAAVPRKGRDYVGRLRGPSGGWPSPYCSGFGYWLSSKALAIITGSVPNGDKADDREIGNQLRAAGIRGKLDDRYKVMQANIAKAGQKGDIKEDRMVGNSIYAAGGEVEADYRYAVVRSKRNATSACEGPRKGNQLVATCEYEPKEMRQVHQEWLTSYSGVPPFKPVYGRLDRVSILIKTFLRDGMLQKCLASIQRSMPEVRVIVVDDGYETKEKISLYARMRDKGHACLWLPFDSGFGKKSNAAIPEMAAREFCLIGCDDFDFSNARVREGMERMVDVLDSDLKVGMASGRVNAKPYEGFITRTAECVSEKKLDQATDPSKLTPSGTRYWPLDLTVNYGMLRTRLFKETDLHWCPEFKIGADHFLFFDALARTGKRPVLVDSASVPTMPPCLQWQHPNYSTYRARAIKSLPAMFNFLKIKEYVAFGGAREVIDLETMTFKMYSDRGLARHFTFEQKDLRSSCSRCGRQS